MLNSGKKGKRNFSNFLLAKSLQVSCLLSFGTKKKHQLVFVFVFVFFFNIDGLPLRIDFSMYQLSQYPK